MGDQGEGADIPLSNICIQTLRVTSGARKQSLIQVPHLPNVPITTSVIKRELVNPKWHSHSLSKVLTLQFFKLDNHSELRRDFQILATRRSNGIVNDVEVVNDVNNVVNVEVDVDARVALRIKFPSSIEATQRTAALFYPDKLLIYLRGN